MIVALALAFALLLQDAPIATAAPQTPVEPETGQAVASPPPETSDTDEDTEVPAGPEASALTAPAAADGAPPVASPPVAAATKPAIVPDQTTDIEPAQVVPVVPAPAPATVSEPVPRPVAPTPSSTVPPVEDPALPSTPRAYQPSGAVAPGLPAAPQPYRSGQPYSYPRTPPISGLPVRPQTYAPGGYIPPESGLPTRPQAYTPGGYIPPGFGQGPRRTLDQGGPAGFSDSEELAYESSVRTRAMIEQGQKGPLDGGWTVVRSDGTTLYALQLVDDGYGTLDGAWRTTNGAGARSGFFSFASRYAGPLVLRFQDRAGAPLTTLTLSPAPGGRAWSGQMERGGETRAVTMRPL